MSIFKRGLAKWRGYDVEHYPKPHEVDVFYAQATGDGDPHFAFKAECPHGNTAYSYRPEGFFCRDEVWQGWQGTAHVLIQAEYLGTKVRVIR